MWVWSQAPACRNSATRSSASIRTPPRSQACAPERIPIFEPGLDEVVAANVKAGRLSFETNIAAAVKGAGAVFIAVGTPSRRGDGHADLSYVFAAAEEIATALTDYAVVVTKSTVPVGTSRKVEEIIRKARGDAALRHGLESGIPARRLGDRGFPPAGPRGGGLRHRAGARRDAGSLSPALYQRDAHRSSPAARPAS